MASYPKRVFRVEYCKEEKLKTSEYSTSGINYSTWISGWDLQTI
jgi:hypothetical protein